MSAPSEATAPGTWTAQAEEMWSAWHEAQRGLWEAWSGLAGGAAARGADAPDAGDDPIAAWQGAARRAVESATAGADPLVRDVAKRLVEAQQMTLRVAGVMARAWGAGPQAGEDGATAPARAFEAWAAELRRAATDAPAALSATAADSADLWRQYQEGVQRFARPWADVLDRAPGHFGGAMTGDHSELSELMRLNWDAWERSVGRVLESPSLGFTRETEEKLVDGFDTWIDYRREVMAYQSVLGGAWADAAEAMAHALLERAEAGAPVTSLRDLGTLWTEVGDGVLEAAFRSEAYAAAQGRMVNAAMRYRMAERTLVETSLKMTDIPSRGELDEALHEIHTLRRELRALRRELRAATGGPTAPGGDAA